LILIFHDETISSEAQLTVVLKWTLCFPQISCKEIELRVMFFREARHGMRQFSCFAGIKDIEN
jgi:hypothetical protein